MKLYLPDRRITFDLFSYEYLVTLATTKGGEFFSALLITNGAIDMEYLGQLIENGKKDYPRQYENCSVVFIHLMSKTFYPFLAIDKRREENDNQS